MNNLDMAQIAAKSKRRVILRKEFQKEWSWEPELGENKCLGQYVVANYNCRVAIALHFYFLIDTNKFIVRSCSLHFKEKTILAAEYRDATVKDCPILAGKCFCEPLHSTKWVENNFGFLVRDQKDVTIYEKLIELLPQDPEVKLD